MNIDKQSELKERHCGNCSHHGVYSYPEKVFCVFRFLKRENAITNTLDVCENWTTDYQECFCVQEALKHRTGV